MLNYSGKSRLLVSDTGRRITVHRGQKVWDPGMVIEASSLRRSGGDRSEREDWTKALLAQFRRNILGAMEGDRASEKRLEGMLLNAQRFAFQNPFVAASLSYSVARGFANVDDTSGYVLTIEGPWYSGIDFEFLRKLFGLYGDAFDYQQEYGLPDRLGPPFTLVRVDKIDLQTVQTVFP